MIAPGPSSRRASATAMSSWPEMHAISVRGERHIDTVVDDERHVERRERRFDRARLFHHDTGFAHLVAQLNKRRAALGA